MVARAAFPKGTLAMRVRDRLGEVFADEPFTSAFWVRGAPGLSSALLLPVSVLQYTTRFLRHRPQHHPTRRPLDQPPPQTRQNQPPHPTALRTRQLTRVGLTSE